MVGLFHGKSQPKMDNLGSPISGNHHMGFDG